MKRIVLSILFFALLCNFMSFSIQAEDYSFEGDNGFYISFNGKTLEYMKKNKAGEYVVTDKAEQEELINKQLSEMEPGDSVKITYVLKNDYGTAVDWWMGNEILDYFEEIRTSVKGGNYTYKLTYFPRSDKEEVLYNSERVGGKDTTGFVDATSGLYNNDLKKERSADGQLISLEKGFSSGKTSKLVLEFKLDGESQMNNYQDVEGILAVKFAVELPTEAPSEPTKRIVYIPYTGDTFNATYYVIAEVLSLILLLVVIWRYIVYRRRLEDSK